MKLWNWLFPRWFYTHSTPPSTNNGASFNHSKECDDVESASDCVDYNKNGICDYLDNTDTYESDHDNFYNNNDE